MEDFSLLQGVGLSSSLIFSSHIVKALEVVLLQLRRALKPSSVVANSFTIKLLTVEGVSS